MFLLDGAVEEIRDKISHTLSKHVSSTQFLGQFENDPDTQDGLECNNPKSYDTIGNLTYKLNCVCIQMWENQEFLYAVRKMTADEFKEKYGNDLTNLHRIIKRCCDLNYQRSLLMDAIDKKAVEIASGHAR